MLNYRTKVKFKLLNTYFEDYTKTTTNNIKVNENLPWHGYTDTDAESAQRDVEARALHDPSMTTDEHILLSDATLV